MAAISSNARVDSFSPIGSLPPEIAEKVCTELETPDITSLRRVSKFWMTVATPWFLPRVHLIFKPDSFRRLVDISKHRVIRHNVTSLFYEADALRTYQSRKEWEADLHETIPSPLRDDPAILPPGATERERRAHGRDLAKRANPPKHTEQYLRQAYAEYERLYNEQNDLRLENYGAAVIADAMSRFPKLSNIRMSLGHGLAPPSDYSLRTYAPTLQEAYGDDYHDVPSGVAQMQSLLLGADLAQLQLTHLEIGEVDWKFLWEPADTLKSMKKSLKCLRSLALKMSLGTVDCEEGIEQEIPECREYLENYQLYDFLIAAPGLEGLRVGFNYYDPYGPSELKYIAGSFTWSSLRNVTFEYFDTTEEDWVAFFVRHSPTLRKVAIDTITLLSGTWVVVLERMSEVLNLESAYFRECLISDDPRQQWYLDGWLRSPTPAIRDQGKRTRKALREFLVSGGICPLRDEEAHPQAPYSSTRGDYY